MERNLRRGHNIQSSESIHITVSPKGFHHRLLVCLCVIGMLHHIITLRKDSFHISVCFRCTCTQISPVIRTHGTERFPVLLRMNQNLIILRFAKIQNRRQFLIFYLYQFHRFIDRLFILTCHNGNRITHITHPLIQNQPVIRTWLRKCLTCHGKSFARCIFIGKNTGDPRHFFSNLCINLFYNTMCNRTSKHFTDQTVLWCNVIRIYRFSRNQCHRIFFSDRLIYKMIPHDYLLPPVLPAGMTVPPLNVPDIRYICINFLPDIPLSPAHPAAVIPLSWQSHLQ